MARLTTLLLLVTLGFVLRSTPKTNALFFVMEPSQERCFFEEIPHETLVLVKYKLELWESSTIDDNVLLSPSSNKSALVVGGLGLKAEVKDPDGAVILSKTYGGEGRFGLTSHRAGDHIICLASNDTSLEGFLRVYLDIKVGGNAVDYEVVKNREKLTELQLKLRQLQDLTDHVIKEQNYQRSREQRFRLTSESTNQRVVWIALLQTAMLISISIYQVRHIKMFFIRKKLV